MVTVLPALHDDVIVLTGYTGQDMPAHLNGANGHKGHRFGRRPKTTAPATIGDPFARWADEWETGGSTRAFAAREQDTGRLLGGCELRIQPRGSAHVCYWISPADQGFGYATRSLVLLLRYAHAIGIRQAEAHIAADNHASRRVAEKAGLLSVTAFTAEDGTGMVQYLINLTNSTY
jgi:RimJ/RimL family protein N-acetyltransferase